MENLTFMVTDLEGDSNLCMGIGSRGCSQMNIRIKNLHGESLHLVNLLFIQRFEIGHKNYKYHNKSTGVTRNLLLF